ncbi:MAG TPA: SIMPL domain-containing protein [Rubrivivax sp.]|nr:SIMPL domain-containing protein [Rubrivivax sp.]
MLPSQASTLRTVLSAAQALALRALLRLGVMVLVVGGAAGHAQMHPPPEGVVTLSASATAEVPKDWISVTLSTTRDGSDAPTVQAALRQALDAALQEARRTAKPAEVEFRTGNFALFPRYAPRGGVLSGWQGTAELIVEGRDTAAIGQLIGRIRTLTVARISHDLSRELREKTQTDVSATAIARYRQRAADVAKQFGYARYVLREVQVSGSEPPMYAREGRMQAMAASAEGEPLPIEAGKATVTVNVSGSVQLLN